MSHHKNPCRTSGPHMGGLLEASLLMLLSLNSAHGYHLISELESFGFDSEAINTSAIYRQLRSMESKGLISSNWQESEVGPSKRTYQITEAGRNTLIDRIEHLKQRKVQINILIENYERLNQK